ncbi:hypothetical protein [Alteromonas gilva]|uniref:Uncharacterized protein n=1 Tax=Alteromonas gilva TaxID=2987522 RepID=A0ABT5LA38_9ALTE|nr:hypothetical protein [Alteromonas gilva]MDC8832988.1 hypothetical protein [Alteromonas gilva]
MANKKRKIFRKPIRNDLEQIRVLKAQNLLVDEHNRQLSKIEKTAIRVSLFSLGIAISSLVASLWVSSNSLQQAEKSLALTRESNKLNLENLKLLQSQNEERNRLERLRVVKSYTDPIAEISTIDLRHALQDEVMNVCNKVFGGRKVKSGSYLLSDAAKILDAVERKMESDYLSGFNFLTQETYNNLQIVNRSISFHLNKFKMQTSETMLGFIKDDKLTDEEKESFIAPIYLDLYSAKFKVIILDYSVNYDVIQTLKARDNLASRSFNSAIRRQFKLFTDAVKNSHKNMHYDVRCRRAIRRVENMSDVWLDKVK